LADAGFVEVETPVLGHELGGATARPFVTHHNALDLDMYLRVAPELYLKRLIVGGFERVFEINRNFRNEGISVRHNPEFTMMEFYAAYWNYQDLMDFTEALIRDAAEKAVGTLQLSYSGEPVDLARPFERLTIREAILRHTEAGSNVDDQGRERGGLGDIEQRYRQRYVDLAVSTEVRDVFVKRSLIVRGLRRFFDARGFLEVETPMMHTVIGGAAARPFVTHHNALDMTLYMRIAPELYLKRLLVGGFERVYEINRNFRNEGLSRQHNPEFTMLEFYQAYATYEDLMELTQELLVQLATEVNGTLTASWDGKEIDLAPPWRRLSIRDAVVEEAGKPGAVFEDPLTAAEVAVASGVPAADVLVALLEPLSAADVEALGGRKAVTAAFGDAAQRPGIARKIAERYAGDLEARVRAGLLGYRIFEQLVEPTLVQPTFLTQFPLAASPLARKNEADPAFCDRFELFIGGAEMANAFSELNDPDDQRARFQAQLRARAQGLEETMDYDEDYCRALEVGMPSAAGEGIGIDRITMLLTGQSSIRDVILFPLMRPESAQTE
ncbi:MAG TPA: amino acid--tRNA ligase-related protein, partial [Haliangium sp.]|nr:amino acid--tRNA ligase-related protein [Haliangium sp.]